jgi:hypothetical protein
LNGLHIINEDHDPTDGINGQLTIFNDECLSNMGVTSHDGASNLLPRQSSFNDGTTGVLNSHAPSLQPIKGPPNGTASNIVLYMTTHLSNQHKTYLECLPSKVFENTQMLAHADIIVQTFGNVTSDVIRSLKAFPNRIVRLADLGANIDKQHGAMKGLAEAFSNGWLTSYEWMIRVNPDVVIWSEVPLMAAMKPSDTWGVFANCVKWKGASHLKLHTDFFAIRPNRVSRTAFTDWGSHSNAEGQATEEFRFMIDGKHSFILVRKAKDAVCRVRGAGLWHSNDNCSELFQRKPWISQHKRNHKHMPLTSDIGKCA